MGPGYLQRQQREFQEAQRRIQEQQRLKQLEENCVSKGGNWANSACTTKEQLEALEQAKRDKEIAAARALNVPILIEPMPNEAEFSSQKRSEINVTRKAISQAKVDLAISKKENERILLRDKIAGLEAREKNLLQEYTYILRGDAAPRTRTEDVIVRDNVGVAIAHPIVASVPAIERLDPMAASMVTKQIVEDMEAAKLVEVKAATQAQSDSQIKTSEKRSNVGLLLGAGAGLAALLLLNRE